MGRTPFRRAAAAIAAALLLAACGDDTDTQAATDDTVAEATTTTATDAGETTTTIDDAPAGAESATTLPPGADQLIEVTVAGGRVEGGGRHEVAVGDTVAVTVTTDSTDEVHVHGYDVYADVGPGAPTTFLVEATIPGVWEVELHDSGILLLELAVS